MIVPLETMQILSDQGKVATEIGIKIEHPERVDEVLNQVRNAVDPKEYGVISWKTINQNLLKAVQFENLY